MIELWQTEWCPASRRVRQRLTELGLDCTIHQVPVAPEQRERLEAATGGRSIPVLTADGGVRVAGEEAILAWLDEHFEQPPGAAEHRAKAEKSLRRLVSEQLQEEHA